MVTAPIIEKSLAESAKTVTEAVAPPSLTEKPFTKPSTKTTVRITDLLKAEPKKSKEQIAEVAAEDNQPFTKEALHQVWLEFAEQRKMYQAEYQLLAQPFTLNESTVEVNLLSMVQETMLNNIKSELTTLLRERLKNNTILVKGVMSEVDDTKIIYTSRDKFTYLLTKNPVLQELKDRLGLDTDF